MATDLTCWSRTVRERWPMWARRSARPGSTWRVAVAPVATGVASSLCVQDPAAARTALEGAGITVHEENDAILGEPIKGADSLARWPDGPRDRRSGVNVRAMYLATGNRGVLVTDDNAKVRELMAAMM